MALSELGATSISRKLTLTPVDNRRLANLCGQCDEHLRQIENRLGVEIASRGNQFRIIGASRPVEVARRLIQSLFDATATEAITPHQVHLSMQDSSIETLLIDRTADKSPIQVEIRHMVINGRGPNQQSYLRNIASHDINFGIGPAGTGKTYLAVACAVAALEQDRVKRLILARPAVEAGEKLGFLPGDLAQKWIPI
jgi:Phosphate starvation-inducible protein PhoH, predicted ATPase